MIDPLIAVVEIHFHGLNNLVFYKEDWDKLGGWKGFLKEYRFSIKDIHQAEHKRIKQSEYPTNEWEP